MVKPITADDYRSIQAILRKSQKFMDGISCTSDASSCGNGATTEEMNRPEGRKKAKLASAADTEESSILKQLDHDNKMRNDAFLAETKRKNDLIEEQMTIDLFRTNIESDESKAFFSFMRKKNDLVRSSQDPTYQYLVITAVMSAILVEIV
ncbi:hypothetical protein F444_23187 [Phytophthora nicotianae P1976]|uniref:No apical meristem-associated C-terminal domain-containing protein n=1 Tax=Phytophthora nicotianae P1976 TaxID=1317066 RepID=A0A080YVN1_PHYNI|nr:hypothetical protein F444_23187 [Phytophthora nicotianae P1976]